MAETRHADCRKNCWTVAAGGGLVVAALLALMAQFGFFASVLGGLVFFCILGFFLVWAFCPSVAVASDAPAAVPGPTSPEPVVDAPLAAAAPDAAVSAAADLRASEPAASLASSKPAVAVKPKAAKAKPATRKANARPAPAKKAASAAKPAARKASTASALDAAVAKAKDIPASATELLDAPRGGKADNLKMIKGVGPKLEILLNEVGVWHFDQIAAWKAKDIAHVDEMMVGFHGRITRDGWVKQAKGLAKGIQTEFSERVKKGDVY